MSRVPLIRSLENAGEVDAEEREELQLFFSEFAQYLQHFRASVDLGTVEDEPAPPARAMWAAVANSPRLARELLRSGEFMTVEISWCRRTKLRELMYLALASHLGYHSLFAAHHDHALRVGLRAEQLAHLEFHLASDHFDEEERFVISYTQAVLDNGVTDGLFEQGRTLYGNREMVELTAVIAYTNFKVMTYRALRAFEWREVDDPSPWDER